MEKIVKPDYRPLSETDKVKAQNMAQTAATFMLLNKDQKNTEKYKEAQNVIMGYTWMLERGLI